MEINKIAQCSKMVPGMSGSEIRAALTAVNWDTVHTNYPCLFYLFYKVVFFISVLRVRNVDPGSEFFPCRIRIKEYKYFNPKNSSKLSGFVIRVVFSKVGQNL